MLAYDDQGAGPAVVLLHGYPFDRTTWSDQVEALAGDYRLITPDLPGHGRSPAIPGTLTIDEMAEEVVALIESLQLPAPPVVGGLSMGGYVALAIAENNPELVRALLLLNTRAGIDSPSTARGRKELATMVEEAGSPELAVRASLPKLFAPATYQAKPELVERMGRVMRGASAEGVAAAARGMAVRPDRTDFLGSIKVPTLVLAGEEDQLIPLEESRTMAAAIPGARFVVVPGAGHLAPLEQPERTNAALREFLGGLA
ncbi:alpha/beta fold hydrolase [Isosphaeraceae bacterium EP7]